MGTFLIRVNRGFESSLVKTILVPDLGYIGSAFTLYQIENQFKNSLLQFSSLHKSSQQCMYFSKYDMFKSFLSLSNKLTSYMICSEEGFIVIIIKIGWVKKKCFYSWKIHIWKTGTVLIFYVTPNREHKE